MKKIGWSNVYEKRGDFIGRKLVWLLTVCCMLAVLCCGCVAGGTGSEESAAAQTTDSAVSANSTTFLSQVTSSTGETDITTSAAKETTTTRSEEMTHSAEETVKTTSSAVKTTQTTKKSEIVQGTTELTTTTKKTNTGPRKKIVVLTFDDASASHYSVVAPILQEYGFGATFFVTEMEEFATNKDAYMTWEEIKALNDMGFEIGNHGYTHTPLGLLDQKKWEEEIVTIEERCAQYGIPKPVSYAWPGGVANPAAYTFLKERGYLFARGYEVAADELKYEPYDAEKQSLYDIPHCCLPIDMSTFSLYLKRVTKENYGVLLFHGVPDTAHTNVSCTESNFRSYMEYLKKNQFKVIAMRDLPDYLPEAVME